MCLCVYRCVCACVCVRTCLCVYVYDGPDLRAVSGERGLNPNQHESWRTCGSALFCLFRARFCRTKTPSRRPRPSPLYWVKS